MGVYQYLSGVKANMYVILGSFPGYTEQIYLCRTYLKGKFKKAIQLLSKTFYSLELPSCASCCICKMNRASCFVDFEHLNETFKFGWNMIVEKTIVKSDIYCSQIRESVHACVDGLS